MVLMFLLLDTSVGFSSLDSEGIAVILRTPVRREYENQPLVGSATPRGSFLLRGSIRGETCCSLRADIRLYVRGSSRFLEQPLQQSTR